MRCVYRRPGMALAWTYPELHQLLAQQRAVVFGMLAQPFLHQFLQHANLLSKVINAHLEPLVHDTPLIEVKLDASRALFDRLRPPS